MNIHKKFKSFTYKNKIREGENITREMVKEIHTQNKIEAFPHLMNNLQVLKAIIQGFTSE